MQFETCVNSSAHPFTVGLGGAMSLDQNRRTAKRVTDFEQSLHFIRLERDHGELALASVVTLFELLRLVGLVAAEDGAYDPTDYRNQAKLNESLLNFAQHQTLTFG